MNFHTIYATLSLSHMKNPMNNRRRCIKIGQLYTRSTSGKKQYNLARGPIIIVVIVIVIIYTPALIIIIVVSRGARAKERESRGNENKKYQWRADLS